MAEQTVIVQGLGVVATVIVFIGLGVLFLLAVIAGELRRRP